MFSFIFIFMIFCIFLISSRTHSSSVMTCLISMSLCNFYIIWLLLISKIVALWLSRIHEVTLAYNFILFSLLHFLLDIFFIYISNAILKVPYTLPCPAPHPTHSCFLALAFPCTGTYDLRKTKGLSSHSWPTRPSSATYATRDTVLGDTG